MNHSCSGEAGLNQYSCHFTHRGAKLKISYVKFHFIHVKQQPSQLSNTALCRVSVVFPRDGIADWEPVDTPPLQENVLPYIASSGKDKNSKHEKWLLLTVHAFHTIIKSKNRKSNCH